ncbi:hypothetical protein HHI36_012283 [Cryptolaemus montrouzieri]|uniref:Uncharacterized protein n=1 Tax=Cryptolaemus montrouzieri TaxID=559131 RepID=A0ABD2NDT3_9CUCU
MKITPQFFQEGFREVGSMHLIIKSMRSHLQGLYNSGLLNFLSFLIFVIEVVRLIRFFSLASLVMSSN